MNKQIILGRIGNIEKKSYNFGSITKLSVATNERYTKKDGSKVDETTWHSCEAFGALADTIDKFFAKGDGIYLEGKTKHEKYEKDGVERYSTKVKVEMFSFVPGGSGKSETTAPAPQQAAPVEPEMTEGDLPF